MAPSRKMRALGRRGGLAGGRARARALTPPRRIAIARQAARSRWNRPVLVIDRKPRDHGELLAFVAHYGSDVARSKVRCSLEDVALRAVLASRRDPALARMLPVFLWRVRDALKLDKMIAGSRRRGIARALGYFLDVTGSLGSWRGFDAAIAKYSAPHIR